ncbi:MAG: Fur family transcriptional regulator, ferric uptake regulator [Halanaerobium sp. 4-GBenrich]|jgi:Fur family ferric uptake transcriptional regulator|uniref:Fur family ferric uptake transcriptional regulator n=1 Tax=Halanaerobium congolense TaxID=54121 RepID=A0A1M7H8G1_9FIRM|nr:Fur family transcriptional regulator [Halanaerobium congolense]ODS50098.1 MAG: Fur family transcriptional regulator, ferric uptake regulator [Halanaerobium sp. 4-GBenrich]PTX16986.1 Fur family ferric uptake transcriptional regulator [Halanaerobium congolense]TDS31748.1 Fur family ferric uptake transcriptional regulator [Halanaerobium congolense]SDE66311.1 Fur family transcriptional regulator, ferric uptake regulator [Halanaerobium congolense]SES62383.1 Fur family transcriptional regulator, 
MENLKEKFKRKLAENNYKLTKQREVILGTILGNKNWHFTAEDLFAAVKKKDEDIGMATIYRTLELMQNLKIINVHDFNEDSRIYELYSEESHHHHLICKKCGKLVEFSDQDIDYLESELEAKYDFKVTEHKLRFYGYCRDCK